ncbi:DNA-damage-repair/toleration protein DRT111 [Colletotrichum sp. SAR 10_77]|nr:DNA-damage-repair/toleration protein DRT111 [Colletotrichum sp. SAR 10_77]
MSSSNPPPPPPPGDEATISRAPVRYTRREPSRSASASPPPALGLGASSTAAAPDEDADAPRSNRPGQAGFAQRLMSKYGWTKGSGLGADEGGIVNPLRVQVEKRKKKSDAEGGGWAEPANRAKILGGRRKDAEGEGGGKFGGPMSEVIVLQHMLDNMEDLQGEIANGLGQEIGEECGEKYGRVERLYIDVENRQVFIRFTDQVSALRAVNELDGRIFNGNTVIPKFYDTAKFEQGIYR